MTFFLLGRVVSLSHSRLLRVKYFRQLPAAPGATFRESGCERASERGVICLSAFDEAILWSRMSLVL